MGTIMDQGHGSGHCTTWSWSWESPIKASMRAFGEERIQILPLEGTPIQKLRMWYMISLQAFLGLQQLGHFFLALDSSALRGDDRIMAVRWLSGS